VFSVPRACVRASVRQISCLALDLAHPCHHGSRITTRVVGRRCRARERERRTKMTTSVRFFPFWLVSCAIRRRLGARIFSLFVLREKKNPTTKTKRRSSATHDHADKFSSSFFKTNYIYMCSQRPRRLLVVSVGLMMKKWKKERNHTKNDNSTSLSPFSVALCTIVFSLLEDTVAEVFVFPVGIGGRK
jgi:hypothetical protein